MWLAAPCAPEGRSSGGSNTSKAIHLLQLASPFFMSDIQFRASHHEIGRLDVVRTH